MDNRMVSRTLAGLMVLASPFSALGAEPFCLGSFQNTSYAALLGLSRYRVICDDGNKISVQKTGTYSGAAQEGIYLNQALPLAEKLGVIRIQRRERNTPGSYDVFFPKSEKRPERIALLSRSLTKARNGARFETLILSEGGKNIYYPTVSVPSIHDLSNVQQVAKEEGLSRSGALKTSLTNPEYQVFILYR